MRFLPLFLFAGLSAHAQATANFYRLFPVLECPAVGEEYEKMLSKLEAIKVSIKEDANCEDVAKEVKSLKQIVVNEREKVVTMIDERKAAGEPLTEQETKQLRTYAEDVTKKVSALNDLFLTANYCFREDQTDGQLATLASFVGEASELVGSVSGPWGTPIALAGNIVAGFLTGMDQVLKARQGYDFSKREQWMSFVQNLCTYHSYRDQIDHLLNPAARVSQLAALKTALDSQLKLMKERCPECRDIEAAYDSEKGEPLSEYTRLNIQSADHRFARPYGTYTIQNLGIRDWVTREIARIEKEAQSYWSDVSGRNLLYLAKKQIEEFLLQKEAPRFLDFQAAQARRDYNSFIGFSQQEGRDVYDLIDSIEPKALSPESVYPSFSDPLGYFRALVIKPVNFALLPRGENTDDTKFAWVHFRDQSLTKFRAAQTSAQVVQSFCSFFKHAGQYSPDIRGVCGAKGMRGLLEAEHKVERELSAAKITDHVGIPFQVTPDFDQEVIFSMSRLESLNKMIMSRDLE
ncbi:MAG TPA: hypothetical protein PKC28_00895 [Bdellovibrionales bacterium]|nr:hypothetical protein [Bdellovibrionales bacterium]